MLLCCRCPSSPVCALVFCDSFEDVSKRTLESAFVYTAAFVLTFPPNNCAAASLVVMSSPPLTAVMASRLLRSLPSASAALLPSRGLKIPRAPAKFDIKNMPAKHRLGVMPRAPTLFATAGIKIPKGEKDLYRIQGEELVHNKLILGQFGIVAVSGGQMKHQHFDILRYKDYVTRNLFIVCQLSPWQNHSLYYSFELYSETYGIEHMYVFLAYCIKILFI